MKSISISSPSFSINLTYGLKGCKKYLGRVWSNCTSKISHLLDRIFGSVMLIFSRKGTKKQVPKLVKKKSLNCTKLKTAKKKLKNKPKTKNENLVDDSKAFAFIRKELREKSLTDLRSLFPSRLMTKNKVKTLTVDDLLKFKSAQYFEIVDLISPAQGLKILRRSRKNSELNYRALALYHFNSNFNEYFASKQQQRMQLPIDKRVRKAAQNALFKHKKYNSEAFQRLQKSPSFKKFENLRMNLSSTLSDSRKIERTIVLDPLMSSNETFLAFQTMVNWRKVNNEHLLNGILSPTITLQFLKDLNSELRKMYEGDGNDVHNIRFYHMSLLKDPKGIRRAQQEVCVRKMDGEDWACTPGEQVENMMNNFIIWLNESLIACDKGKENPIIIAALCYQKFISIHPFFDGNGRTATILSDMILRRYQLLPAIWNNGKDTPTIPLIFPYVKDKAMTPSKAVEGLLKSLKKTYSILETN